MPYANNKGADQPAHLHSPISTFVVHCLDSIIPLVSISEISSLCLASLAAQAGFSYDEACIYVYALEHYLKCRLLVFDNYSMMALIVEGNFRKFSHASKCLTLLCQLDSSILTYWRSSYTMLGVPGLLFHFYFISSRISF